MNFRSTIATLALVSLPTTAIAQDTCITRGEAEILVTALSPAVIDGVRERCSSYLPRAAALVARGNAMVERYQPAAAEARVRAIPIALKMMADNEGPQMPEGIGDEFLFDMFETVGVTAITAQLDAENCARADDIFAALEPLPASNFASLLTTFMVIGSEEAEPGDTPIRICPRG